MFKITPMTGTIIKNLLTRKSTRAYPHEVRTPYELARGELYNNIEDCIFCSICERKCPSQCISVDKKNGIWTCDPFACVYCGICVEACPSSCLHHKNTWRPVTRMRETISMQGTPPKPKKKASSGKEPAKDVE